MKTSEIKKPTQTIEINEQFKKTLNLLEQTDKNVFITGKAGTGKSTLLKYFMENTGKKAVVLAPTGVAALNVQGETIHSFFGFRPDITLNKVDKIKVKKKKLFLEIDTIIIDEISMVRADLLDCVGRFLKLNGRNKHKPFGGVQMVFIGDLYQLPPVVTSKEREMFTHHYNSPYFFSANIFKEFSFEFIELEKIYRQKDEHFIRILNKIRNNSIENKDLAALNSRTGIALSESNSAGLTVYLTTTNAMAGEINEQHLNRLKSKIHTYLAEIEGDFDRPSYPTEEKLSLAAGAQVMMLNNDSSGRWVNGTVGMITGIRQDRESKQDIIDVKFSAGNTAEVLPHGWEIFHYKLNEQTRLIDTETVGIFTQYPLRLAWAVTIHKSQGKTFDRIIIDIGKGAFAHGQVYVALSRCTSLEGISLKKPLEKKHIFMDWRIVKFMTNRQYELSEQELPLEKKISMIENAIKNGNWLEIVYLKANDEKSKRAIKPHSVGNRKYLDKDFIGMDAYCSKRREDRVFRIDRILRIKETEEKA
ncbi:MAG: AAA family ATPase [Elusimicrobia bacterium RIFOXYA2_FULL_39_19]|nr:MAG: AAA family ATPase [Elusimicrobia bacterium RIFOXYA2_FULL_39_19]